MFQRYLDLADSLVDTGTHTPAPTIVQLKLNTKIGLQTTNHPPPPQTFFGPRHHKGLGFSISPNYYQNIQIEVKIIHPW